MADHEAGVPRKKMRTEGPIENALPEHISYVRLAEDFAELQPHLVAGAGGRSTIDFRVPDSVRVLNRALLHVYFGLDVHLPSDSLCPAVANRLSYLTWIRDNVISELQPGGKLAGLDIGTGASCIYPLLGSRAIPGCTFVGTDINRESIAAARANVLRNGLQASIDLVVNADRGVKLPLDAAEFPLPVADADGAVFAFCMCNPPFYKDSSERQQLAHMKARPPGLDTGGKCDELYTAGGEEEFLAGLVDESVVHRKRIRWFTTMTGKKSTLAALAARARAAQAKHVREGRLVHGRTTRWVLAWSFYEKTRFCVDVGLRSPIEALRWFEDVAAELGIHTQGAERPGVSGSVVLRCSAAEMTWTRQWRRQKKLGTSPAALPPNSSGGSAPALEFTVEICGSGTTSQICLFLDPGYESRRLSSLHGHLAKRLSSLPSQETVH
ncbi:Methyltransferase-like protein 16 [Coemansia spiralis]|nr:Methyltransferase-like protein 16 [Coemansia spiralis]